MNDLNHIYKVGNLIRYLREKNGMSQSQLGTKLGVSNKAISKWENGRGYPDTLILLSLANELNVTVDEILKGELKENKTDIKVNKINSKINYIAELTLFKKYLIALIPNILLIIYLMLGFFFDLFDTLTEITEFIIGKHLGNHEDMILFIIVPMWITVIIHTIIAIVYVFKVKHLQATKFMKILTSIIIFFAGSLQYFAVLIYMIVRLIIAKGKYKRKKRL